MRNFLDSDYREWMDRLAAAESLLPQDSAYRADLTRIREQVESMRQQWRERQLAPKFELFLDVVGQPLEHTAATLHAEIQRLLNEREFILVDEGDVPEHYKKRVAEYFKALAASEGTD